MLKAQSKTRGGETTAPRWRERNQAGSSFGLPPAHPPRFRSGQRGACRRVAREIGLKTVLLVTDSGVVAAGHAETGAAVRCRQQRVKAIVLFDKVRENPANARRGRVLAWASRVASEIDGIVGLGGGSGMDTAKGCNFLLTNGGRMQDYWGLEKAKKPMLPFIAIPTTAGTGSECQSFALIADEATHQKMACGDPKAAARIAILDPVLTLSQPRRVAACTGMDALSHALETTVTTRRNPLSLAYSREAFHLCWDNFPRGCSRNRMIWMRGPGCCSVRHWQGWQSRTACWARRMRPPTL